MIKFSYCYNSYCYKKKFLVTQGIYSEYTVMVYCTYANYFKDFYLRINLYDTILIIVHCS